MADFVSHPFGVALRKPILMLEPASILTLEISRRLLLRFQTGNAGLILIADDSSEKLAEEAGKIRMEVEKFASILNVEVGQRLKRDGKEIEPFGFADGISQPLFLKGDIERAKNQGTDKWDPSTNLSLVLTKDPNGLTDYSFGSYLVYRKLEQNVAGFKRRLQSLAEELEIDEELAGALAVGRFQDGTPVTLQDTPGMGAISNNFNYADERDGNRCPFHAHIRKSNPRGDTVPPLREERQHRIVRRSTVYGTKNLQSEPTEDIGLLFMCYQSDIANQFEFIQDSWANQVHFARQNTGLDPIIGRGEQLPEGQLWHKEWGGRPDSTDIVHFGLAHFVSMKGGEYFFAPSIGFLKQIE